MWLHFAQPLMSHALLVLKPFKLTGRVPDLLAPTSVDEPRPDGKKRRKT